MKNNLINDTSPYLQQHKDNPVHWQIWSKEILEFAKKNKKPILLSIGYASCHWCHVMAHESFEDEETASLLNKYFINIKVDREERPDIDFIFQSSYQLFNQTGGGWPLTMFLDENAVPFMGGTYFPKEAKHGLPSFKEVIEKVRKIYSEQNKQIIKQSSVIIKSLELKKTSVISQDLEEILNEVISNLDNLKGGYKGAPKFPIFNVYETMLYFFNKTQKEIYLKPLELILKQLCTQGIYDHVEGGISRYTVDENWLVPHFEKMLYDNAQFVSLLSKYVKIKKSDYYENKIVQTVNFINKNFLNSKKNLLGSAYDADSEGEEGKYYTFTYEEIKKIQNLDEYFDIKKEGNWEGKIILREIKVPPINIILKLKEIRKNKTKPFFDNKVQLDLNCLWVSALLSAHRILPKNNYLTIAESFFEELNKNFLTDDLFHTDSKTAVFIEDYAFAINMLLDLHEETLKLNYMIKAKKLCEEAIEMFFDKERGVFQKNKKIKNDLFYRPFDIGDHTISNGNSIMLLNFSRLGMKKEGQDLSNNLNRYVNHHKLLMISSLKSIDYYKNNLVNKNCTTDGCDF